MGFEWGALTQIPSCITDLSWPSPGPWFCGQSRGCNSRSVGREGLRHPAEQDEGRLVPGLGQGGQWQRCVPCPTPLSSPDPQALARWTCTSCLAGTTLGCFITAAAAGAFPGAGAQISPHPAETCGMQNSPQGAMQARHQHRRICTALGCLTHGGPLSSRPFEWPSVLLWEIGRRAWVWGLKWPQWVPGSSPSGAACSWGRGRVCLRPACSCLTSIGLDFIASVHHV